MNRRKHFNFRGGSSRCGSCLVAGAGADLPKLSLCRRHAIPGRVFPKRFPRLSADRRQGGDAPEAPDLVGFALFGRRRHAENYQDRHHRQARETADDGVRADVKQGWTKKGRNIWFRPVFHF